MALSASHFLSLCIPRIHAPTALEPAGDFSPQKSLVKEKKRKKWKAPTEKKNASTKIKKRRARAFVRQTAATLFVFRTLRPRGMPPKFILL